MTPQSGLRQWSRRPGGHTGNVREAASPLPFANQGVVRLVGLARTSLGSATDTSSPTSSFAEASDGGFTILRACQGEAQFTKGPSCDPSGGPRNGDRRRWSHSASLPRTPTLSGDRGSDQTHHRHTWTLGLRRVCAPRALVPTVRTVISLRMQRSMRRCLGCRCPSDTWSCSPSKRRCQ